MIICVIDGKTIAEARLQIEEANSQADLLEFRIDLFEDQSKEAVRALQQVSKLPVIFTLRSERQGGAFQGDPEAKLKELASLKPDYIDGEWGSALKTSVKSILSYHDFSGDAIDYAELYLEMKKQKAHFYKIALTPKNATEALKFLVFSQGKDDLIAVNMGAVSSFTRILSQVATYTSVHEGRYGQVPLKELISLYGYKNLNSQSRIYGLIGDPVEQSIGHLTHNPWLKEHLNAVYVKIPLKSDEIGEFFALTKQLPFSALSVTMPLKEKVLSFLDEASEDVKQIGACNTLLFKHGKIHGENTDGRGALNALEKLGTVASKRIVVLGAGGSAKAIAHEARKRGAEVVLLGRTARGEVKALSQCEEVAREGYDYLINCTPDPMPIETKCLLENCIVMDIRTSPQESPLLAEALNKKCQVLGWQAMFYEQALLQRELFLSA